MACACVDCFFRALEAQFRYGLHPEPEAGQQPPKRLLGVSPNMGQPGEVRSCPVGLDDCTSPTPTTPAGRSASIPEDDEVE